MRRSSLALLALLSLGQTAWGQTAPVSNPGGKSVAGLFSSHPPTGAPIIQFGYGPAVTGVAQGDQIRCAPAYFPGGTITALSAFVKTVSSGGLVGEAMYSMTSSFPRRPYQLLVSTLNISTTNPGMIPATVTATTLPADWYFQCNVQNNGTSVLEASNANTMMPVIGGSTSTGSLGSANFNGLYYTLTASGIGGGLFSAGNFAWPADLSPPAASENTTTGGTPVNYPTM